MSRPAKRFIRIIEGIEFTSPQQLKSNATMASSTILTVIVNFASTKPCVNLCSNSCKLLAINHGEVWKNTSEAPTTRR